MQAVASVVNNELPQDFKSLNKAFNPYFVNAAAGMGDDTAMYALKIQNFSFEQTDFQGRSALHSAARWGKKENIKFLIKQDIDLNFTSNKVQLSPLAVAIKYRNYECAQYLYKKGATFIMPRRQYSDLLCELGKQGDLELLQNLQSMNCDLNVSNFDGRTVGHLAASFAQIEILRYLAKETDFNFQARDRRKQRPLDYLSSDLRNEIMEVIKSR